MKITTQLLRSRAQKPLHACEILDLSNLGIEYIDKIQACPKLRCLALRGNHIDYVSGLDTCSQLWKLDLSNNKIQNLDGLRRHVAMGTLILSNNILTWPELTKLRHMHILDLSLHGNPDLEKDPYYRIHVIDTLPNIWMLDGRIITSAERVQVQQFFEDSALTEKPVRHKVSKEKFTPTMMKRIEVTGVFGERTDHLMRRFPVNGVLNIETDKRRLKYLAFNIQTDIELEAKYNLRINDLLSTNRTFLEDLLNDRSSNRVRCNMMLLILVASLEFAIPIQLMREALSCAKLDTICTTDVMSLFLLPREWRCLIVSLLLSAVKVDKDVGEDGGLYDKLYLCLYYSVSELTRLAHGVLEVDCNNTYRPYAFFRDSKSLIASEVVQLFCVVPAFFECLGRDSGVMNLVAIATADPTIVERIQRMMKRLEKDGCDERVILESVSQLILTALQQSNQKVFSATKNQSDQVKYILNTKMAIPRRPKSSIASSEYHSTGRSSPEKKTPRLKSGKHERRPFIPIANLGEKVLLGPQNIGRIISVPEPDLCLIQMDVVPAATGAMIQNTKNPDEHFTYVDMSQLYWDNMGGFWRPRGTVGDRITLHQGFAQNEKESKNAKKSCNETKYETHLISHSPRTNGHAQLVDLIFQAHDSKEKTALPEPVSARYKKLWNLKLSWKHDSSPEESGEDRSKTPAVEIPKTPASEKPEEHQDESEMADVMDVTESHTDHLNTRGDVTSTEMVVDEALPVRSASRRSSLDSDYEPELEKCVVEMSRPSTAGPLSRADSEGNVASTPAAPIISIPQMVNGEAVRASPTVTKDTEKYHHTGKHEHVEFETEANIVNKDDGLEPSRPATGRGSRSASRSSARVPRAMAHIPTWPRPISAVDTYRMILSRESRYYTEYQNRRANSWKNSTEKEQESAVSPPPQRPCSPVNKTSGGGGGHDDSNNRVKVQRGEVWLGGGRDLHYEKQLSRPKTAHTPGWLESMPQRPQSAAAVRAMRRSKTPNIATPSSIAYESLFVMDSQSGEALTGDYISSPMVSPIPGSENLMSGAKLKSHPFAKYVYIMRERHRLRDSVMCSQCKETHRKQEEELRKVLGTENTDLVNKLVAMEPCNHGNQDTTNQLPAL